jgi:NTE family protein
VRRLKVGLALGAGGIKGGAHIGVMRVLSDAGIDVDVITGTSIGSLWGAAFAVGRGAHEIEEQMRAANGMDVVRFFRHRLKIRHKNPLARRFYEGLAGFRIEDLPVRYAATASDIVERSHVTIDRGPVIDAVEASIAIPLIARPVVHQGRYLLDGGFWDSAPVDAAVSLGADVIIAVELGGPYRLPAGVHSAAEWMARRFERVSLQRTLAGVPFSLRAFSCELTPGRTADIILRPTAGRLVRGSPFHMSAMLDAGIAAANEALPAIRALVAGDPIPAAIAATAPTHALLPEAGTA